MAQHAFPLFNELMFRHDFTVEEAGIVHDAMRRIRFTEDGQLANLFQAFADRGFANAEIRALATKGLAVLRLKAAQVHAACAALEANGFSREHVRKIVIARTAVLNMDRARIAATIKRFHALLGDAQAVRNYAARPSNGFSVSTAADDRLDNLRAYGFTEKQVTHVIRRNTSVINLTTANINAKFATLEESGFSRADVVAMVSVSPNILSVSWPRLRAKLFLVKNLGFSHAQALDIFRACPSALVHSSDRVRACIDVLQDHGVDVVANATCLITSPTLLAARCRILKANGGTYSYLHLSDKAFTERFGRSSAQLVARRADG